MYKVIKAFTDLRDNNYIYHVGDKFPRNGAKVSDERLEELSTAKNRRKTPLIEKVEEKVEKTEKSEKTKKAEKAEVVEEKATDVVAEVVEEAPKKRSRKKKEDVENAD